MKRLQIGFLASGNGSSACAIMDAMAAGDLAADPRLMVSNMKTAGALEAARARGVPALCIPTQKDPQAADARIVSEMEAHAVDLIVMSGYLRRLGPKTLARYAGRIINIHPGPLPRFGGEGMYGRRVHEAVLAAGVPESGVVIHVVDEEYDHGPQLATRAVPVLPGDSAEDLEARVKAAEPPFFVETLRRIAEGALQLPQPASSQP
ncbi:phosphoribosylglycinamide formyltransferase [Phenylobacterium deserti]|uniref:Phosphoribosylglycinamide formyltransferase n=1 Tax=Phenylobacterium deserti TaxID=1914756 RepID=A0A328AH24_9CAUL|nr:phosphoribosylglycinamide formyltransferase [Phenylobacterium deserti]RAK52158.1 phosphoribosylglycinamide formyltransferase [Phenylobacterium deserti]